MPKNHSGRYALWAVASLLDIPDNPGLSSADRKHARAANIIALIGVLVFLPWIVITALRDQPWVLVENSLFVLSMIAVIGLNRAGRRFWSALVLAVVTNLQVAFSVYAFGFVSQSHLFYAPLMAGPYLIFTRHNRAIAHAFAVLAAMALFFCFVLRDSFPLRVLIIDVEQQSLTNVAFCAASLTAMAFAFVRMVDVSEDDLTKEQKRSERLLLNVLPQSIAERLKDNPGTMIADRHPDATILFADIVGFTALSSRHDPPAIVKMLSELFSRFDEICDRHGVEKIHTMGDGYMAVAGVPKGRPDHALAITRAAIDIRDYMASKPVGQPLQVRIGMNSGDVVAGIVGRNRFHFDIWGDAVNVAARMESTGEPGRIQISERTWQLIHGEIDCVQRGTVEVKGKGQLRTWFVA